MRETPFLTLLLFFTAGDFATTAAPRLGSFTTTAILREASMDSANRCCESLCLPVPCLTGTRPVEDPSSEALGECFGFCEWTGLPWSPGPFWPSEGFGERSSSFRLHGGGTRERIVHRSSSVHRMACPYIHMYIPRRAVSLSMHVTKLAWE